MPPTLVVCGPKKCGKTTLIGELIARLRESGLRVATLKHSPHPHPLDKPGSDTDVHKRAGAVASALLTPAGCAIFTDVPESLDEFVERHLGHADLVLVEGLGKSSWPKLLLHPHRDPTYVEQIDLGTVLAVVTDRPEEVPPGLPAGVRLFAPQQTEAVAGWIKGEFLGRRAAD